jgi:hypothetical protein
MEARNNMAQKRYVALERNRRRSVPDIADGRHGDAAFADNLLLIGYSRRF